MNKYHLIPGETYTYLLNDDKNLDYLSRYKFISSNTIAEGTMCPKILLVFENPIDLKKPYQYYIDIPFAIFRFKDFQEALDEFIEETITNSFELFDRDKKIKKYLEGIE